MSQLGVFVDELYHERGYQKGYIYNQIRKGVGMVSRRSVQAWISDETTPTIAKAIQIADVLTTMLGRTIKVTDIWVIEKPAKTRTKKEVSA